MGLDVRCSKKGRQTKSLSLSASSYLNRWNALGHSVGIDEQNTSVGNNSQQGYTRGDTNKSG